MPRSPKPRQDDQEVIYRELLEVCQEVRALFSHEQAEADSSEKSRSAELDLYRQNLGAGLERLRGKFQEKLGESQRD